MEETRGRTDEKIKVGKKQGPEEKKSL